MSTTAQKKLLDSAHELFLKYGVKSVSMDDIARMLGISKKTIYNLVQNKKGLVHSVVSAHIEKEEQFINDIAEKSQNALDEMISIARHVQSILKSMKPSLTYDLKKYHPETWELIDKDHFKFIENHIQRNLVRGIEEGLYIKEIRTDIIPKLFVNISRVVAEGDFSQNTLLSQSEIYESAILYHLNGIMNNAGRKQLQIYLSK